MTLGIVLSGGGARGAYEAGVLSYVFGSIPHATADIIAGTSVGAYNGAFLAAISDDFQRGTRRFIDLWQSIELGSVFRFGVCQAADLGRVVLGGRGEVGVLDVSPLAEIVSSTVPWSRLAHNLAHGPIRALSISTTHVPTGRTIVFVDSRDAPRHRRLGTHLELVPSAIRPAHVLASTAIPVLFPPVRIDGELYCEGGLRLNTPMAPALELGADRLLVIAVSTPATHTSFSVPDSTPGLPFLLGKVLNAFLLDHVTVDLEHLDRINMLLQDGIDRYGSGFVDAVNQNARQRGTRPWAVIQTLVIRPSIDIGRLAEAHLRKNRFRFDRILGRSVLRLLDVGEGQDADLASYLLFDGEFVRELVALGRKDAHERRDEIAAFGAEQ